MAILFAESFDGYASTAAIQTALQTVSNDTDYSSTRGRWGGGAMNAPNLDVGMVCPMKAAPATNLVRVAFHFKGARNANYQGNGGRPFFRLRNSANNRFLDFGLTSGSTGNYTNFTGGCPYFAVWAFDDIYTPNGFSNVGATSIPVNDGNWHHIEVEYVAHNSTGSVKIWIDGLLEVDRSNIDTNNAASGDCTVLSQVLIAGSYQNGGSGQTDTLMDDVLVWDDSGSDFTGHLAAPHRLRNVLVNASGDSAQFTPNTGANNAAVDDATFDDDTTYVESSTVGHVDLYNVATAPNAVANIKAVIVETIGKDTSAAATHRGKIKSNGTVADGTTSATMANAYRKYQSLFFKDPDGNIDWTQSKVEAAQTGQEVMS